MTKQGANLPKRGIGESQSSYDERIRQWLREDQMPRVKGDLRDWTGSYPFHLDKQP